MARIDVYLKNERLESKQLDRDPVTIGRQPDNSVMLGDLTVSRQHARLEYIENGHYWMLENLSRTNPARLNGELVQKKEIIFDGDHISIGAYTIVFRDEQQLEQKSALRLSRDEAGL